MAQDEYLFKILLPASEKVITKDNWTSIVNKINCGPIDLYLETRKCKILKIK